MKSGFVIASMSDDGTYNGYFSGDNFDSQNLDQANIIENKTQARAALGNLQRVNPDRDLTVIPVQISISFASQATTAQTSTAEV